MRKKDDSWCFYIDYHALNTKMVCDVFPTLVMDELCGATFFTKLDLHSGYHQVRMHPDDVQKTALQMHMAILNLWPWCSV
jgi:hypothetical protein